VLSRYKYRVYLLPPGACGFVGLGYVGCDGSFQCRAWIGAGFWASPSAIAHEVRRHRGRQLVAATGQSCGPTCPVWIHYNRAEPLILDHLAACALQLGHNLFLAHAGAYRADGSFDEYADFSSIMVSAWSLCCGYGCK
jgi:hypothetical protein